MKLVQAYKCEFCHRCFGRPVDAHNHEVACKNNPKSKRCVTCKHCSIEPGEMQEPPFPGADAYQSTEPTCLLKNITVHDGAYFEECEKQTFGCDDEGRGLPGTCWNYEYKGYAKYEKAEAEDE